MPIAYPMTALCGHVDGSRTRSICMPSRSDPTAAAAGSAVRRAQQVIGKLVMPRLERNKMKSGHLIFVGIFLSIFI